MKKKDETLLDPISKYYTEKVLEYGDSALGVGWNSDSSQLIRFDQLLKVISDWNNVSINDLGCGYGALCKYLYSKINDFKYYGYDISSAMTSRARELYGTTKIEFINQGFISNAADYSIASGIFNIKLDCTYEDWTQHVYSILDNLHEYSKKGFAFNCLTSYSDSSHTKDYLYYSDPCHFFHYCKTHYSPQVALLHDYGLYDYTILVKK